MNSRRFIVILMVGMFLVAFSSFAYAATVIVDSSGATPNSYTTIQAAVTAAGDDDSISILKGTYKESVVLPLNRDLKIIGVGTDKVFLKAATLHTGKGFYIQDTDGSDTLIFSGMTIMNFEYGIHGDLGGIATKIFNCVFDNNGASGGGIWLYNADYCSFTELVLKNGGDGIHLYGGSDYNLIDPVEIFDNSGDGIFLDGTFNTIEDFTIYSNGGDGIEFRGSDNLVKSGTSRDNGANGVYALNNDRDTVRSVTVYGNGADGVYFNNSNDGTVRNCIIYANTGSGIHFDASLNPLVYANNTYENTSFGIKLENSSSGAKIYDNCVRDNNAGAGNAQGYDNAANFWDDWVSKGNYFSDYSGSGSYPVSGPGGALDRAPLTNIISFVPASKIIGKDSTTTFDIMFNSCALCNVGQKILAYELVFTFSPTVVTFDAAAAGGFMPNSYFKSIDDADSVKISEACKDTFALGSGRLATVTFTGIALGNSPLNLVRLDVRDLDNFNVPVVGQNGSLTVNDIINPWIVVNTASGGTYNAPPPVTSTFYDDINLSSWWYQVDALGWVGGGGLAGTSQTVTGWTMPVPTFNGLSQGLHQVFFLTQDAFGNWSTGLHNFSFYKDTQPPTLTSIALSDNGLATEPAEPGWTNENPVKVIIVAGVDAVDMQFQEDALAWGPWIAFSSPTTFTFTNTTEGTKTLKVRVRDAVGNVSGTKTGTIILDTTNPPLDSLVINNWDLYTNTTGVNAVLFGWGPVDDYNYFKQYQSGNISPADTGWKNPLSPFAATLTSGDGTKTISVFIRDKAGNISSTVSDNILLDTTTPSGAVTLSDSATGDQVQTKYRDLKVTLGGVAKMVSGSPVTDMYRAEPGGTADPGWIPYAAVSVFNVSTVGDGQKIVQVWLKDAAGNQTPVPYVDSILLDTQAPNWASMYLEDKDSRSQIWTNSATIDVVLGATGATKMWKSHFADFSDGAWAVYDDTSDFTVGNSDGLDTVWCKLMDDAENETSVAYRFITLDTQLPTIAKLRLTDWTTGDSLFTNDRWVYADFLGASGTPGTPTEMMLSENSGFVGASWVAFALTSWFQLSDLDGSHTVYGKVKDAAGNVSAVSSWTITLDRAGATATVVLNSTSNKTTPPYSSVYTPTYNITVNITASGSPTKMQMRTGVPNTGWIPFAPSYAATLFNWGEGTYTVDVDLKDAADNITGPFSATITYDVTGPASAPSAFSGSPASSVHLSWTKAAGTAGVEIRRNPWHGYPEYFPPAPPYPSTPTDGFLAYYGTGTSCEDDQLPDIYYYSAFSYDSAGNYSAAYITCRATSYILGDFNDDDKVDFNDLGVFATAYYTIDGGLGWNNVCDIGPTDDGTKYGIPEPDDACDFDDLVFFILNYNYPNRIMKKTAPFTDNEVAMFTRTSGNEIELSVERADLIAAGHLVLEFPGELTSVERGGLLNNPSIFFKTIEGNNRIDLSFGCLDVALNATGELLTLKFNTVDLPNVKFATVDFRGNNGEKLSYKLNSAVTSIPKDFSLSQNYPNPFNLSTSFDFSLPQPAQVRLHIYNLTGQLVRTLVDGYLPAGNHSAAWDGTNSSGDIVASGVYFYRLAAGNFVSTKKMILLK